MPTTTDMFVERAERRTGLDDWHNQSFRRPLDELSQGLAGCQRLSQEGRAALEEMIVADLSRRLQVDHYLAEHPHLVERPVSAPLFVGGMPRTGTTLVINLLAQDARRRPLLKWEVNHPVPPATTATLHTDPRCLRMLEADQERVSSGSSWADIHFEWADEPRECVYVMAQNFTATSYEAFAPMPNYSAYLFGCDMTPTYEVHKRMLQTLQAEAPGDWTLKAPSHILWIPEILRVYPDARIVWTHRDPVVAVSSLCSLITRSQGTYCTDADHDWIRRHYPEYCLEHVRRPMAALEEFGDRIYSVRYADLMQNPVGTVRRLYDWLGREFSADTEAAVTTWLGEHPMGKFGRHKYGPADFGLNVEQIRSDFKEYVDMFDVPREDG